MLGVDQVGLRFNAEVVKEPGRLQKTGLLTRTCRDLRAIIKYRRGALRRRILLLRVQMLLSLAGS
jgi:hypothetical protein